jgi:hypothetical protein
LGPAYCCQAPALAGPCGGISVMICGEPRDQKGVKSPACWRRKIGYRLATLENRPWREALELVASVMCAPPLADRCYFPRSLGDPTTPRVLVCSPPTPRRNMQKTWVAHVLLTRRLRTGVPAGFLDCDTEFSRCAHKRLECGCLLPMHNPLLNETVLIQLGERRPRRPSTVLFVPAYG